MDKSFKNLSDTECFFLLNNERYLNGKNGLLGKTTPFPANYPACEINRPAGENYRVGSYYSRLTNELYSWTYNSNGVNYIKRINGDGDCQIVYVGCLELSAEPEHEIKGQFRAWLQVEKICGETVKRLIWVNGIHPIGCLDVEASIATNYFTTPFFERCADPCSMVRLCVPDPCGCLSGEFVPIEENELGLTNHLLDVGIKLAYRHVYYDGRVSLWSDPSSLFYQDTKGCFDTTIGYSRCIKLRVPVGNPMVEKIEIAYSKGELSEAGATIWYKADVIEKYKKYNSAQTAWYERELAEFSNYSDEDCSFDYLFCNDKQCEAIDSLDFNRVVNPMPREPQGLLPINGAIGFFNYKSGNCELDDSEVSKFDIGIACSESNCKPEFATVTVRALIHNIVHNKNQFIYREGGGADNSPDDPTETAWFGGLTDDAYLTGYEQYFKDKTRNLIAYVEGTDYWGEMKQWKAHAYFTNREEWGVVARMGNNTTRNRWRRATRNGEFFYQEVKIKVPKGTKGFLRLSSHHSTSNDQDTSTFVGGILNDINQYGGSLNISSLTDTTKEEIYFDTCSGDVDLTSAFVVIDNFSNTSPQSSAYHGYIKDGNDLPVEGATIVKASDASTVLARTDHNGFYHFFLFPGSNNSQQFQIMVELDCVNNFGLVQPLIIEGEAGANTRLDATITNETYKNNSFANVNVPVVDCNGNPVSGVRVALSGSKYRVTDGTGIARFKARNYHTRNRQFRAVALDIKGCFSVDCLDNCNACMPDVSHAGTACYYGKPTIVTPTMKINVYSTGTQRYGLKSGGRYPFGFVVEFECGKITPVNKVKYLDIPKAQERNEQSFCSLSYNGNGITFPEGAKCLKIVRGENINPFELQWVIDKISRTDDGNIKLTIQSLNDYNEQYFFKTNTIYQWLKGDRIEFIKNGDGKIFSSAQHGILNYLTISPFNDEQESGEEDSPVDFFNQLIIQDDGKLDGLTEGAVIEIQRSKECLTEPVYFTICASIPIVDGVLQVDNGLFSTFDTYLVSRKIGKFPLQKFEHHSPSDFWGTKLNDTGKPHFVNEYDAEIRNGRSITLNTPGEINRFGDFVKTFDSPEHGDIVAMTLNDGKIGLCISEHDNSLYEVGNDLLKADSNGTIRAVSGDEIISNPQPKIVGKYGCQYQDIGSIQFGDGWATWIDGNRHTHVKHDYQMAKSADEGKVHSYYSRKIQEMRRYNSTQTNPLNKLRFLSGYNEWTGAVPMTIKSLRDNAIMNTRKPFQQINETLLYHPASEDYLGFASYTPEGYDSISLFDGKGCAIVSFFQSIPYIHPIVADKWNEFYGIAVDRVIGVSINQFPEKSKTALALEIQDETMWYVSEVSTQKSNFRSEIPAIRLKKTLNKWNAAFLCNSNSPGGLYGNGNVAGEPPRGEYINVILVRDNTDNLKYNTVDNVKRTQYDELDRIMFKFFVNEQSGLTQNV